MTVIIVLAAAAVLAVFGSGFILGILIARAVGGMR